MSGSESESASDASSLPEVAEDAAAVLGLGKKDYARGLSVTGMDGLSPRQAAYCLACVTENIAASDVLECGGELEPWLEQRPQQTCQDHSRDSFLCMLSARMILSTDDNMPLCDSGSYRTLLLLQEALLQDRHLTARKKRDRAQETKLALEASPVHHPI